MLKTNPLWRLVKFSASIWRDIALASLFGSLTILSSISLMATSAWLISKAALQPSIAELSLAVVGVRFFGIARGLMRYLERLTAHDATFRFLARLRLEFYKALEPLAPAGLMTERGGDLLSRIVDDIESLQNLYLRLIAPFLVANTTALALIFLLYRYEPLLAGTAFSFILIAGSLLPALSWWRSAKLGKNYVLGRAEINANLTDQIQGMAELLLYGQAETQLKQLEVQRKAVHISERKQAQLDALQMAFAIILTTGAGIAVLAVAIPRIAGIDLASVTLATIAVFEALNPLSQAALHISPMQEAATRLFEISDRTPLVSEAVSPLPLPQSNDLLISRLNFRYQANENQILENLNLSLKHGQHILILGASGAGKSSLVNLFLRFWDYESGQILLGDHELKAYSQASIRSVFGLMSQRSYLFNTSIRENIRLARSTASDEDVKLAAQKAEIHDFVLSLPNGYDSLIGENGGQLSGGQRQRIALARALLTNAPILVLDEPTANLDIQTERAILRTVLDTSKGRSLIIFSHRRVLLERFDAVYYLDGNLKPYR